LTDQQIELPNQALTLSITSPASGTTFPAPANITIEATGGDIDGTLAQIYFFADSMFLGSAGTSPYSVSWNNIGAGSYTLRAVATDNNGTVAISSPINVFVNPSTAFITSFSLGNLRNDYDGWLGMQFTVGDNPTVTGLVDLCSTAMGLTH
jgi:chitinase